MAPLLVYINTETLPICLLVFCECILQCGNISSDVIGQFHDLVFRIQDFHGLCVGIVTDRERPGDFCSKLPVSKENIDGMTKSDVTEGCFSALGDLTR